MDVTGLKKPIGGPSELACKRFLLALRRNGRFARRGEVTACDYRRVSPQNVRRLPQARNWIVVYVL